jgi:hypothetical protein
MTTYANKHNAVRAARKALAAEGIADALSQVHFRVIEQNGPGGPGDIVFAWEKIDYDKPGPDSPASEPPAGHSVTIDQVFGGDPLGFKAARKNKRGPARAPIAENPAQAPREPLPKTPQRRAMEAKIAADSKAPPPLGKRAAVQAAAAAGELPPKPTFPTSWPKAYFRRVDEVEALAKAGDVAGLRALVIPTYDSGVKKADTYRNLCVTALEAKAAAKG